MIKQTAQQKFWQSNFGKKYNERSVFSPKQLDAAYQKRFGISRSKMNSAFLKNIPKNSLILEVGCNIGCQLRVLQKQGYKNLYGIDIQSAAVEESKKLTKNINIIQGSAFSLPFKDNYFDLVYTSGVLIHISPKDIKQAMAEIYRVSKKFIWGYEYFSKKYTQIMYRGNKNRLWKANFAQIYLNTFKDLKLVKEEYYNYLTEHGNTDSMFLLKKS